LTASLELRETTRMTAAGKVLVENQWQVKKLRMLTWSFTLLGLGAIAAAVNSVLAGAGDALWLILGAFAALTVLGMHVYSARYVAAMHEDGDAIVLRTGALPPRTHRIAFERIGRRVMHDGELTIGDAPSVRAPWITLPVAGYWLPFIIDMQAEKVDVQSIVRLDRRAASGLTER
jgi:hypothetical protein